MRTRLPVAALVIAVTAGGAAAAGTAHAESSPSAYGSRLVSLVNEARAHDGLRPLTVTSGTSTVAVNWTNHLASERALSHNPDLGPQLESHGSRDWTSYGENVGDGPSSSPDDVFNAYMNSPEHRANILSSAFRYVGVGVVFTGSTAWNTLDFVDEYGTSTAGSTAASRPHAVAATPARAPRATAAAPRRSVTAARHVTVRAVHAVARPAVTHPSVVRAAPRLTLPPSSAVAPAPAPAAAPAAPAALTAATSALPARHGDARPTLPVLVAAALIALLMVAIPRAAARRA
jgi:uncharacterized protein YkwD